MSTSDRLKSFASNAVRVLRKLWVREVPSASDELLTFEVTAYDHSVIVQAFDQHDALEMVVAMKGWPEEDVTVEQWPEPDEEFTKWVKGEVQP